MAKEVLLSRTIITCPECGQEMTLQKHKFYLCNYCDGEYWPKTGGNPWVGLSDVIREEKRRGDPMKSSGNRNKRGRKKTVPVPVDRYKLY